MEPAAGRQGATASTADGLLFGDLPHWSPPSDGGSTGRHGAAGRRHARAAMEPADGRREHAFLNRQDPMQCWTSQCSPPLNGETDSGSTACTIRAVWAARTVRRVNGRREHSAGFRSMDLSRC